MRRIVWLLLILMGVMMVLTLSGCAKQKYRLRFDGSDFKSKKTEYAAGEKVTVTYGLIATDTDYRFWLDDENVRMTQNYNERDGYVFTFIMPDHDVTLHEEHHNSMIYIPRFTVSFVNEVGTADVWVLPQTEENLKTSLWGTASAQKLGAGETAELELEETGAADTWMVRIIDERQALYAAKDFVLGDGYRIVFESEGAKTDAMIEVLDESGTSVYRERAFEGVLGGR